MSMIFLPQEEQFIQITLVWDTLTANLFPVDSIWVYWTTLEKSRMTAPIQLQRIINCIHVAVYINSTKQYLEFIKFPFAKFVKCKHCDSFPACTSQIPLFFISTYMSGFTSQSLNKYLHCNTMIFVYKVSLTSRLHLMWTLVFLIDLRIKIWGNKYR